MSKEKIQQTIYDVLKDIFDVEDAQFSQELKIGDLKGWDSIGHVRLLVALEEEFQVKFPLEGGNTFITITSIMEFLEGKLLNV